jgi:signal transduction histidine kinase
MLARIEAALDHERAFLDDASHELRTPIAIARGEIELARPLAEEHSEIREALDSALEEVDRLQVLALNLLVLARTRAAGAPPDEPVDLRAVVDHAVAGVRRTRPRSDVEVQVDGAATTTGDRLELERAVVNLLDNAVRSARSRVVVRLERVGEAVTVELRDDGPGFPEEVVERSRERFVRGPGGGSGLGLAIVDTIAAAHGGVLELEQGTEGGAVARLRLPAGA